jgi:hypothetical protein
LRAQTSDTDLAISRAVQDQANTMSLRQKLEDAKAAAGRGDLAGAAKLYEDAYDDFVNKSAPALMSKPRRRFPASRPRGSRLRGRRKARVICARRMRR